MSPEPRATLFGVDMVHVTEVLLAAGWVPPEAEALRREHDAALTLLRYTNEVLTIAEARVRFLESSWVPPERVETIDLRNPDLFEKAVSAAIEAYLYVPPPRTEGRTLGEAIGAAVLTTWQIVIDECGGGSGKLQIVRAE